MEVHDGELPTNSLWAVRGGALVGRFDKMELVPLAERALGGQGRQRFRSGEGERRLTLGEIELTPLVCYEDVLPTAVAEAEHAQAIVAATHDAWVGPGRGAALPSAVASQTRLR